MRKSERSEKISEILDEYFPNPDVPLKHSDPFTLLVAVLLSAQCTDERVNSITPKLFKKAKNPEKMALLKEKEIYKIIKPCGLGPKKSKAIRELSRILVKKYDSKVPKNLEKLEKLPGVGHKTASVVMSQAFNIPAFPVDTHIHRLASRWGLSNGKNVEKTEKDLKRVWAKEDWNRRHLQIIFFGREFCPAKNHDLSQCQICCWAASKKRINDEKK